MKPAAIAGVPYNNSLLLNAAGVSGGLRFSKVGGPAWLTLAPDGRIYGLPAAGDGGINRFLVRVTDASGLGTDAVMNITVPADRFRMGNLNALRNITGWLSPPPLQGGCDRVVM